MGRIYNRKKRTLPNQLIQNKILKWKKEIANSINKLPRGGREKENWKIMTDNLRPQ